MYFCTACGAPPYTSAGNGFAAPALTSRGSLPPRPSRDGARRECQLQGDAEPLTTPLYVPQQAAASSRWSRRAFLLAATLAVLAVVVTAGVVGWESNIVDRAPASAPAPLQPALPGDPTCPLSTATLIAMGESASTNSAYHTEFDSSDTSSQGCAIDDVPRSATGVMAYRVGQNAATERTSIQSSPRSWSQPPRVRSSANTFSVPTGTTRKMAISSKV